MKTRSFVFKTSCWIVLFTLVHLQIANAGISLPQQNISQQVTQLSQAIEKIAFINEFYKSPLQNQPFLLHIRDFHCDGKAQIKIAQIINEFFITMQKAGRLDKDETLLVFVEGADGLVDTKDFSEFPDKAIRTQAAHRFLMDGKITGPEFLSIVRSSKISLKIVGIEDPTVYTQSFSTFRKVLHNQTISNIFYEQITNMLSAIREQVFSPKLSRFLEKRKHYRNGIIDIDHYLRYLLEELINDRDSFEELYILINSFDQQKLFSEEKLKEEHKRLFAHLKQKMPQDKLKRLMKYSLDQRTGKISEKQYIDHFEQLVKPFISFENYPQLKRYFYIVNARSLIRNHALIDDIHELESKVEKQLILTTEERELIDLLQLSHLFKNLLDLKLSRSEFDLFHEKWPNFQLSTLTVQMEEFLQRYEIQGPNHTSQRKLLNKILPTINHATYFYALALARDQIMAQRTLEELRNQKARVAVVITGGFHSEGITEIFKKHGLNYLIATPRNQSDPNRLNYYNLILDKISSTETMAFFSLFNELADLTAPKLKRLLKKQLVHKLLRATQAQVIRTGEVKTWLSELNRNSKAANLKTDLGSNGSNGRKLLPPRKDSAGISYPLPTMDRFPSISTSGNKDPLGTFSEHPLTYTISDFQKQPESVLLDMLANLPTNHISRDKVHPQYMEFFSCLRDWNLLRAWMENSTLTKRSLILALDAQRAAIVKHLINRTIDRLQEKLHSIGSDDTVDVHLQVVGSKRPIRSDYDITIRGNYAERVTQAFFDVWYETFPFASPAQLFDMNLYSPNILIHFNLDDQADRKTFQESLKHESFMTYLSFLKNVGSLEHPAWIQLKSERLFIEGSIRHEVENMFRNVEAKFTDYKFMLAQEALRIAPDYHSFPAETQEIIDKIAEDKILQKAYRDYINYKEMLTRTPELKPIEKVTLIDLAMQIAFFERDKYIALGTVQDVVYNQQKAKGNSDHEEYVDLTQGANIVRLVHSYLENLAKYTSEQGPNTSIHDLVHSAKYLNRMAKAATEIGINNTTLVDLSRFTMRLRNLEGNNTLIHNALRQWALEHQFTESSPEMIAAIILKQSNQEMWNLTRELLRTGIYMQQTFLSETIESYTYDRGPISVNTARPQDFMYLPGIGVYEAQTIVDHIERIGFTQSVWDLIDIPIVGKVLAQNMRFLTGNNGFIKGGNRTVIHLPVETDIYSTHSTAPFGLWSTLRNRENSTQTDLSVSELSEMNERIAL